MKDLNTFFLALAEAARYDHEDELAGILREPFNQHFDKAELVTSTVGEIDEDGNPLELRFQ